MPGRRKVNPNLMSSPGHRARPNQRKSIAIRRMLFEAFDDLKLRLSGRAVIANRLLQPNRRRPVISLPVEWRIDDVRRPFRPTPDDCLIFLQETLPLHQQTESTRRRRCLGDENEPARFAIEPVDNGDLTAIGNFKGEHFPQCFPKRRRSIRLLRVRQQQRRLIDYDVIRGLINDWEVHGL